MSKTENIKKDIHFNKNEDQLRLMVSELKQRWNLVAEGGGKKKIDKLHSQGKLTARERVAFLLDKNRDQIEIGAFAGEDMYTEHGGCPSGGVVVVLGYVKGRMCLVVANDATVKAGAWFPITGKKNLRAQEIAMENRIPIIYLVDSAVCSYPCKTRFSQTKKILGASSATTP